MTVLTARALNRTTLARQHLLQRAEIDDPVEAVRAIGLVQAQAPPSVHLSVWSRVAGLDLAAVDDALGDQRLVRASLLRLTIHVVPADELAWWHRAMQPALRASRVNDRRYRDDGLVPSDADDLLPGLVERAAASPLRKADAEQWLATQAAARPTRLWWALRTYAPLVHAPTDDPWCFDPAGAPRIAPPGRVEVEHVEEGSDDHLTAVAEVVRRYLRGFGPASAKDIGQASMLPMRVVRPALAALDDELVRHTDEAGRDLWDVDGAPVADGDEEAPPRLLPMWDSTLLVYDDRSRILPERHRRLVIRRNGDTLPTLLVDGHVAGVWRGTNAGVELHAFEALSDAAWAGLEREAQALATVLTDRDPTPYRPHRRWWDRLPAGHVRTVLTD